MVQDIFGSFCLYHNLTHYSFFLKKIKKTLENKLLMTIEQITPCVDTGPTRQCFRCGISFYTRNGKPVQLHTYRNSTINGKLVQQLPTNNRRSTFTRISHQLLKNTQRDIQPEPDSINIQPSLEQLYKSTRSPDPDVTLRDGRIAMVRQATGITPQVYISRDGHWVRDDNALPMWEQQQQQRNTLTRAILSGHTPTILAFTGDWDFLIPGTSVGRATPVTPLSLIVRPQLSGALPNVSVAQQHKLINHALDHHADIWYYSFRAISEVIYQGRVDILELMLSRNAKLRTDLPQLKLHGANALHMACYGSMTDMIEFLIKHYHFDPKQKDDTYAQTPLHWIFARGVVNPDAADVLVRYGADPFTIDPRTCTSPLSLALVTADQWAMLQLAKKRSYLGNKGLQRKHKFDFIGVFVEPINTDPSHRYQFIRYNTQLPPVDRDGWETFNCTNNPYTHFCQQCRYEMCTIDRDPSSHLKGTNLWFTEFHQHHQQGRITLLEIIIANKKKQLLQVPVVAAVLEYMWLGYARYTLCLHFLVYLLHVISFVCTIMYWPDDVNTIPIVVWVTMVFTMLTGIILFIVEHLEMRQMGYRYLVSMTNWVDMIRIGLTISYVIMAVITYFTATTTLYWPMNHIGSTHCLLMADKFFIYMSVPERFGCTKRRNTVQIGVMVVMMKKMVVDMVQYFIMFSVVWGCSLVAFWPYFRIATPTPYTVNELAIELMLWMLGQLDYDSITTLPTSQQMFARVLFFVYALVVVIMMLNMLIAMMGNTYTMIFEDADIQARFVHAREIHTLQLTTRWHDIATVADTLGDMSGQPQDTEDLDDDDPRGPRERMHQLEAMLLDITRMVGFNNIVLHEEKNKLDEIRRSTIQLRQVSYEHQNLDAR